MGSLPLAVLTMIYSLHTLLAFLVTRREHYGASGSKTIHPISVRLKYDTAWCEETKESSLPVFTSLHNISRCVQRKIHTAPDLWEEWECSQEFYKFKLCDEGTEEFNTSLFFQWVIMPFNLSKISTVTLLWGIKQVSQNARLLSATCFFFSNLKHSVPNSLRLMKIWKLPQPALPTIKQQRQQKCSFQYHTPPFGMIIHDREVWWIGRSWAGHSFRYTADTL